jgi:hypothetical protein
MAHRAAPTAESIERRHDTRRGPSFTMSGRRGPREERVMTTNQNGLFANVPRRRWIGGAVTIATWLAVCGAFVTDAVPTRPSEEWLYDVEARRDAHARSLAARAANRATTDERASLAPALPAFALAAPSAPAVLARAATPAAEPCSCQ